MKTADKCIDFTKLLQKSDKVSKSLPNMEIAEFSSIYCHLRGDVHILLKYEKFTLTKVFFPSNQLFSDLFSKCVAFTKFLAKKRESKFSLFPHCGTYSRAQELFLQVC